MTDDGNGVRGHVARDGVSSSSPGATCTTRPRYACLPRHYDLAVRAMDGDYDQAPLVGASPRQVAVCQLA